MMSSWMLRRVEMGGGQKLLTFPFISSAHALGKQRTRRRWGRRNGNRTQHREEKNTLSWIPFRDSQEGVIGSSRRWMGGTFSRAWLNLGTASPDSKLFVFDLGPSLRSLYPPPTATSPHWLQNSLNLRIPAECVQVWILPGCSDHGSKTWDQDKG